MQSEGLVKGENVSGMDTQEKARRPTRSGRGSEFLVCAGGREGFLDLYNIRLFGMGR